MVESIRRIFSSSWIFREKITFALLKAAPHDKDWWENYYEKKDEGESSLFSTTPTCNYFWDAIKEQYSPVGSYEDKYIQWTTLRQQRDQDVHELENLFHTLHTKLGIKDSDKTLVLNYHSCLHIYNQEEIEFLDISIGTILLLFFSSKNPSFIYHFLP